MQHLAVLRQALSSLCLLCSSLSGFAADNSPRPFDDTAAIEQFISEMVQEYQFNPEQLQRWFSKARLQPAILEAIARPAESKPWRDYRPIFITADRIRGGMVFMREYARTLGRASDQFGVPPQIVTAIIGVETRYGKQVGNYPVIDALSTLGFAYPPRASFFRNELKQYLLMAREARFDPLLPRGSYAGAMGMPQFIPSSFRRYAVDFDGNGKRDILSSTADAIGSVANYFAAHDWHAFEPIATRVTVSGNTFQTVMDDTARPRFDTAELRQAGVNIPGDLYDDLKGSLIVLDAGEGPEYWVAWHNFYVITRYNHSILYAMAAYQLSREIIAAH